LDKSEQTIVIRRVNRVDAGAHGGSWKIAFADFALALMAFFLVLWLIESTTELEKMTIAGYFSDPRSIADLGDGGTPYVLDLQGRPLDVSNQGLNLALVREDQEQVVEEIPEPENPEYIELARLRQIEILEQLRGELEDEIRTNQEFEWFSDSVLMEVTEDGLKIQVMDRENRPLFDSGQAELKPYVAEILWTMGRVLNSVPNRLNIMGHTDSAPFTSRNNYSNWELSTDRANAARRALIDGGLDGNKLAQIVGMGSSVPFNEADPRDPANRRIVMLVLNQIAEARMNDQFRTLQRDRTINMEAIPPAAPLEIF
jgi:chemotaxis protein MotB